MTKLNHTILKQVCGIEPPIYEHRFHPERRWRFDAAWPDYKIALEFEGGVWRQGRHQRAYGFIGDMEKYNEAALLGWLVVRVATSEHNSGSAIAYDLVKRAFELRSQ